MADEVKSSAEKAREERKARIEKTSEKQIAKKEKKANQSKKKKILKIVIPVVILVLALLIGGLYYFGVFHRSIAAIKYDNGEKISVAEYEYYYKTYYNYVCSQSSTYEEYYSAYYGDGVGLYFTGYDSTLTPSAQEFVYSDLGYYAQQFLAQYLGITEQLDEDTYGENPTWADVFKKLTLDMCLQETSLYKEAIAAGYKLSDEEQTSIDEEIEEIRETATESNYALTAYLMNIYGRGMNEKLYKELLVQQTIVSNYANDKLEECQNNVTDEEIEEEFNTNIEDYSSWSLCYYVFTAEEATNTEAQEATDTTEAVEATNYTQEELDAMTEANKTEAKANADAFLAAATVDNFASVCCQYASEDLQPYYDSSNESYDESYFILTESSGASFEEELSDWAFDSSRQVGDKNVFEITDDDGCTNYIILLIKSLPEKDDTLQPRSVRHILIKTTEDQEVTDDDGNTTTESVEVRTMDEAKALAEEILAKWQAGDATEDSFIELVGEYSEDSGSSDNGGLYEDIYADGTDANGTSYVTPFVEWMYADGRKVGDVGIVEITSDDSSTYQGYHIMYISAISDKPEWEQNVISILAVTAYNTYFEELTTSGDYDATISEGRIKKVHNRVEDYAANVIAQNAAEAETTTTTTSE